MVRICVIDLYGVKPQTVLYDPIVELPRGSLYNVAPQIMNQTVRVRSVTKGYLPRYVGSPPTIPFNPSPPSTTINIYVHIRLREGRRDLETRDLEFHKDIRPEMVRYYQELSTTKLFSHYRPAPFSGYPLN
ncbi:hypothetical protein J6590_003531 [Homalodisca vitripennis]|nr:hypothetical protein J6590_003531 [Homalodisca vitripennis]